MPVASSYSNELAMLAGNSGGAIQQLPPVSLVGGRKRGIVATIPLAGQIAGSIIGIGRLPAGAVLVEVMLITDTSLGSTTISIGDVNTPALIAAAQTLTTTDTQVRVGKTSAVGLQNYANLYDSTTGMAGKSIEDLVLTTAVAALPGTGTLKAIIEYMID